MADRYPLVYNPSANQLQELQSGDSLDVGNSSIKGATGYATTTGTSAQFLKADGSVDSNTYLTSVSTPNLDAITSEGNTTSNTIGVGGVTATGSISAATATFSGSISVGGTITYEDVTNVDSQGIGTFRQGINVVGQSELDNVNVSGVSTFAGASTFNGRIVGAATNNTIPFLYNNLSDLPSPSDYHGAFAHVHATGKAYFAHAGAWVELVTVGTAVTSGNVLVGTGITMYTNSGIVSATAFYGDGSKLTGVAAAGSGGGALDITSCLFI
tara:strand:- start:595 stop:1404 length:810 start_codon:yes stop_codon:yes gene_type:complete